MSGQPWEDRRGMFQRGKEVHEPGRKMSGSGLIGGTGSSIMDNIRRGSVGSTGSGSLVDKPLSNDPQSPGSPTSQRRRSSVTSPTGKFSSLQQHKRGSESYNDQRASQNEQLYSGGGFMSGWWNSTMRGIKKPLEGNNAGASGGAGGAAGEQKRGVME